MGLFLFQLKDGAGAVAPGNDRTPQIKQKK
jgi:hypothetical protein